jgi:RNA polymerase sigma factor (sigma-70 family)
VRDDALAENVRAAVAGDKAALEAVVVGVQDRIFRLALRILGEAADAEDATQDILIRIVTNLGSFRGEASFTTWAYRVAKNHLHNLRESAAERRAGSFVELGEQIDRGLLEAAPPSPDPLLKKEVLLGCTQGMLLCLDRDHRLALVLGDLLELSNEEAAFVLEVPAATYRKRLERARERVQAFLRARCGVFDAAAPCRCDRQIEHATRLGLLRRDELRFVTLRALEPGQPAYEDLVGVASVARLYQSQPSFAAPGRLLEELRRVISAGAER